MNNLDKIIIGTCVGIGVVCATIWYFTVRHEENNVIIAEIASKIPPDSVIPLGPVIVKDDAFPPDWPTLIEKKRILEDVPWYVDACLSLNDFSFVIGRVLINYISIQYTIQIILWGDDIPKTVMGTVTNVILSRTRIVRRHLRDVAVWTLMSRAFDCVCSLIEGWYNLKGKTLWTAMEPRTEEEIIKDKWDTYIWWWSLFVDPDKKSKLYFYLN